MADLRFAGTDASERRCAVTDERTLPILDAAHIRAFTSAVVLVRMITIASSGRRGKRPFALVMSDGGPGAEIDQGWGALPAKRPPARQFRYNRQSPPERNRPVGPGHEG